MTDKAQNIEDGVVVGGQSRQVHISVFYMVVLAGIDAGFIHFFKKSLMVWYFKESTLTFLVMK